MTSSLSRISAAILSLAIVTTPIQPAFADGAQKAAADQLFDDAKKSMDSGDFKTACPKLEESMRLDPGDGTFLRLAFCYENLGRLATAWSMYREGLANAKKSNNTQRIDFATKQIALVEPRLSKVTIVLTAPIDGLAVSWDGKPFIAGTAVPVDGGKHAIAVTAPGKEIWETNVEIAMEKDAQKVVVPALEEASSEVVQVGSTPSPRSANSKVPAIVAFSAGGIFVAGAVVSRILMGSAKDDYTATCAEQRAVGPCNDDSGKSKVRTWETLSFVGAGLGLAAIGTGVVLLTTSGSSEKSSGLVVSPTVGLTNGITVTGEF